MVGISGNECIKEVKTLRSCTW